MIENEAEPSPLKVLGLAARYGITADDAQFIALAEERGLLCITEDRALRHKFPEIAVSMDDFLKSPADQTIREKKSRYRSRKRKT